MDLIDVLLVSAMGPPGGGRNHITPRFLRHFNCLGIESFDDNTMQRIFGSITEWHFQRGYDGNVSRFARTLVTATAAIYKEATLKLLPTPAKSHYLFNLRDFARVIRGVMMAPASHLKESDKLIRLWVHEVYRVFYDRLTDASDRQTLFDSVKEVLKEQFKVDLSVVCKHLTSDAKAGTTDDDLRSLFFGDYMVPGADPRVYDEISDATKLQEVMNEYLAEYNQLSKSPMSLVMFRFAIEHVSRISRVMKQPNGHALLVGMGGSGRQSSTKLAAAMGEYQMFRIELTKNYTFTDWRDDIKKMHRLSG